MKLATINSPSGPRLVALKEGKLLDLHEAYLSLLEIQEKDSNSSPGLTNLEIPADTMALMDRWVDMQPVLKLVFDESSKLQLNVLDRITFSPSDVDYLPPIPRPRKIWGVRGNYLQHRVEMSERTFRPVETRIKAEPKLVGFLKAPTSLTGHEKPIVYPRICTNVEHEIELAVVISSLCRRISEEKAYDYVAGYSIILDMSSRSISAGDDGWVDRAKGFDSFAPMGPYLVTTDDITDPHALDFELRVNGVVKQKANTRDMIYSIPRIIAWASDFMTLEPGDVIATGTCFGVGEIKPGDLLEASIDGIGLLRNRVMAES